MARLLWIFVVTLFETLALRRRRGPARPTWTLRFEWIVAFLRRDWATSRAWSFPRLRADLDARVYPQDAVRRVTCTPATIGGVPGTWFVPPEAPDDAALIYLHGGSYIFGSTRTHGDIIARLALASGVRAFAPSYRLAPEHPYPAALEDALAVLAALEATIDPRHVVLAGDSAGGNLALAVQLARRDQGLRQAAAAALLSPWLDLAATRASYTTNADFDYGSREMLLAHAAAFAGAVPLGDPRVSLVGARLDGLAPILVQIGDAELLYDEGSELADKARAAGVDVTLDVLRDMPHNGAVLGGFHAEGARGAANVAAFVARHTRTLLVSS